MKTQHTGPVVPPEQQGITPSKPSYKSQAQSCKSYENQPNRPDPEEEYTFYGEGEI